MSEIVKDISGDPVAAGSARLSPATTLLFAIACGVSVANIYMAQPLFDMMAHDLTIDPAVIGLIVTVTQIGYALGLVLIVPLGDIIDRRRLILTQTIVSAIVLAFIGLAQSAMVVLAGLVIVGLLAVVVQILVAYAASLASPASRGQAIGVVTSGVVIGILLARVFAGILADFGGWRLVYLTSAGLMLCLSGLLYLAMPQRRETHQIRTSYATLLRSTLSLFVEEPLLRVRAGFAFLIFAGLNVFWSAVALELAAPPLSWTHAAIGMLGLVGVAGAMAAGGAGRLVDRGHAQRVTGSALLLMLLAWLPLAAASTSVTALMIGIIAIDLAVQAVHVTNQSLIFAARPDATSRLVGGYMVFYSLGSAGGAIASTLVYSATGWPGVCVLGGAIAAVALLFWMLTLRKPPARVHD